MLRQFASRRSSFAPPFPNDLSQTSMRYCAAPSRARRVRQIALIPFAAAAVLLAGVIYVLLLPVCGIATIAGGIAAAGWRSVREAWNPPGARRID